MCFMSHLRTSHAPLTPFWRIKSRLAKVWNNTKAGAKLVESQVKVNRKQRQNNNINVLRRKPQRVSRLQAMTLTTVVGVMTVRVTYRFQFPSFPSGLSRT